MFNMPKLKIKQLFIVFIISLMCIGDKDRVISGKES